MKLKDESVVGISKWKGKFNRTQRERNAKDSRVTGIRL